MARAFLSTLQSTAGYLRSWLRGGPPVREGEVAVHRGERVVPASVYLPRGEGPPDSAWILLHGITRPGRAHPNLVRVCRALASSGTAVLVPEVPEWIDLELAPGLTLPTVRGAMAAVEREWGIPPERTALMGFSFGAPQALAAAGHPDLAGRLAGVAGFGGYFDLERTFRFLFTGLHEWEGVTRRRRPDPYGRWIVAANFLEHVPGHADAAPVRDALRALTARAGELQVPAWDPVHDAHKVSLKEGLPGDLRGLFDRFAPPSDRDPPPDDDETEAWIERLTDAARRVEPLADVADYLGSPPGRVHLLHGEGDDLIPYTETLRLSAHLTGLRPEAPPHTAITRLFAHSAQDRRRHPLRSARETARFVRALTRMLSTV